jgi:hypothetical protein
MKTTWMTIAAASLLGLVACSSTNEQRVGRPTTLTQAEATGGCPLGVLGALVTAEETTDGVILTFLAPPDRVAELRMRARDAAAMYGPDARKGMGHEGHHGEGGQHGLQLLQMRPVHATFSEVDSGARIVLVPVDINDKALIGGQARERARAMNTSCH